MSRRLLPLGMLVSLWPVGFIAVNVATASNHSSPNTVQVTVPATTAPAATQKKATVRLKSGGKTNYCPTSTRNKLSPNDQRVGELQLELTSVRQQLGSAVRRLKELDKLYPGHTAPTQAIADEYNGLLSKGQRLNARANRLADAYNNAVDEHNHVLKTDCS